MTQVGDKIRVLIDGANFANVKAGDEFIVRRVHPNGSVSVEDHWSFTSDNYEVIHATSFKNPIEYLKTARANGDTINPETMLRECYGITKTERVVTEWSVVKREIKVGDKVRIVGDSNVDYEEDRMYIIGDTATVSEIGVPGYRLHLNGCLYIWFPASSVELV